MTGTKANKTTANVGETCAPCDANVTSQMHGNGLGKALELLFQVSRRLYNTEKCKFSLRLASSSLPST